MENLDDMWDIIGNICERAHDNFGLGYGVFVKAQ